MCHRGVGVVGDQPAEALVGEEADVRPVRAGHIAAAGVEVAQQQDVLSSECSGSVGAQLRYYYGLRFDEVEFCEW